ncbi:substrate-binding domain-containing protein [Pengzhenrongella phosphoraccumulans]|uniref:substrate-binding domain-containing protein n=1 Tax=Pengzhenrongella phosphoraccumulans TaxID=3114394 RepID=UPI0038901973
MKRTKVATVAAVLLTGAISLAGASSASADFAPQTRDVVGVGSDTIQYALNYAADGVKIGATFSPGYNSSANARLVSFNALNPSVPTSDANIHDTITLKSGTTPIVRPDGSGAGKALLFGATNNTAVDFARSSSALSAAEVTASLKAYPFGLDKLAIAVSAQATNAPAAISLAQVVSIYSGAVTNWNQIGGSAGVIVPMIPQAGSGTRSFFEAQLKAANGGTAVVLGSSVVAVQEHDPSVFTASPNAVAPFSIGRAGFANATGLVRIETGTASDGGTSFLASRAVYNVVRGTDASKAYVSNVFGSDGFLCSSSATGLIKAAGLDQLASPIDGGACGTQVSTTAAVTNFTIN